VSEYRRIGAVAALLALVPFALGVSNYAMRIAVLVLVFSLLAVALNVVFGHTDQLFLFVGGLAGVGAYTTALTAAALAVPAWLTLPLGVALCGAIAGFVSWIAAKRNFTVILISILTLNLQLAFVEFFVGARSITRGSTGFPFDGLLLRDVADTLGIGRLVVLYWLLVALLTLSLAGYVRLIDSKYGVAFDAIREDETAAESIGVDVIRYKTIAGTLAGALIGLTGVTYVSLEGYVTPSLFTFLQVDVLVLIMLIVGGLRTTLGPVVGATVIVLLRELLSRSTEYRTAVFGALLIVLFLYFRSGIVPAVADTAGRFRGRGSQPDAEAATESGPGSEP